MTNSKSVFQKLLEDEMKSPTFKEEYERISVEIKAVDDLINAVESAMLDINLTKEDLASKISISSSALKHLLTPGNEYITFRTVLDVLNEVGMTLFITKKV